jgi:hypothetical protein
MRRKQGKLRARLLLFVKRLDDSAPGFSLAVIDLAEVQHLTLNYAATRTALRFDDVPVWT